MTALLSYSGGGGGRGGRGGGRPAGRGGGRGRGGGGRHHYRRPPPPPEAAAPPFDSRRRTNRWVRLPSPAADGGGGDGTPPSLGSTTAAAAAEEEGVGGGGPGAGGGRTEGDPACMDAVAEPNPARQSGATASKHVIMTKQGRNRLVLSSSSFTQPARASPSKSDDGRADAASRGSVLVDEKQANEAPATGKTLMREGKHKLVAVNKGGIDSAAPPRLSRPLAVHRRPSSYEPLGTAGSHFNPNLPQNRSTWNVGLPNERGFPPSSTRRLAASSGGVHSRAAKRIKLSTALCGEQGIVQHSKLTEENQDDEACTGDDSKAAGTNADREPREPINGDAESSMGKPSEKLTDSAYRETSRVRQRPKPATHNLRWSKDGASAAPTVAATQAGSTRNGGKNMGLVRVQRDEKRTPICTTFLRGVECTNPYCRKRHDVPKEHAMPVCSFFQRHGQCLKGDECVFRHVKVNARAMVCPSFALLGFCEDEQCPMQHVHAEAGARGGSGGTAKAAAGRGGTLVSSKR